MNQCSLEADDVKKSSTFMPYECNCDIKQYETMRNTLQRAREKFQVKHSRNPLL
jgi:hypothetical protein